MPSRKAATSWLLSILIALIVCSCNCRGCGDPRPASKNAPLTALDEQTISRGRNVVLLIIDALRADGAGCYGYHRKTTPNIDRLAARSFVFDDFHSASPWTAPSFGSILTGLSPSAHGLGLPKSRSEIAALEEDHKKAAKITMLARNVPVLAELARARKMATGAIVNNPYLDRSVGIARGFDTYDLVNPYGEEEYHERSADGTTRATMAWLDKHGEEGFFLLVHYIDPHLPYEPPAKYRRLFTKHGQRRFRTRFNSMKAARRGRLRLRPRDKRHIRDLYDAEVRFTDEQLGVLFAAMKRRGLLSNTWLVVTSDHGEEHFDHGSFEHGHRYEEEVTRVPLIIRPPGRGLERTMRITKPARHVDLMPTILDFLSIDPPDDIEGSSLMPLMTGEDVAPRTAFMEYNLYWTQRSAVYDGRYKLVVYKKEESTFMYDLKEDPKEKRKLKEDHEQFERLKELHDRYRKDLEKNIAEKGTEHEEVELPEKTIESLRALGYME